MEIQGLEQANNGILIHAIISQTEFEQLNGQLKGLCIFAPKLIITPTSIIKTGARHSCAKYLLFPKALRHRFKGSEYAFDDASCGAVLFRDTLYVIYEIAPSQAGPSEKSFLNQLEEITNNHTHEA